MHTVRALGRGEIKLLLVSLVLLGGLVAAYTSFGVASRSRRPLPAYPVVVRSRDCVWVVDGDTSEVTHGPVCFSSIWRTVVIGDVEVGPNNHLYISLSLETIFDKQDGRTILEFDPVTGKTVRRIRVQASPGDMAQAPAGKLYVSTGIVANDGYDIVAIDMASGTPVRKLRMNWPCPADRLIAAPVGKLYLSSCWSLAAIDTSTSSVSYDPDEFRPTIEDITLGPDGHLYVLLYDRISVVNPANWSAVASIQDPILTQCNGMRIAAITGKCFVTCHDMKSILLYDVARNSVSYEALPGDYFDIAAVTEKRLYLVEENAENVLVLDAHSLKTVAEINLPSER